MFDKLEYTHLAWDLNVIHDAFQCIVPKIPRTKTTRTYCGRRVPSHLALSAGADCPRCNEIRREEIAEFHKLAASLHEDRRDQ
jgi:hypothetical protein